MKYTYNDQNSRPRSIFSEKTADRVADVSWYDLIMIRLMQVECYTSYLPPSTFPNTVI